MPNNLWRSLRTFGARWSHFGCGTLRRPFGVKLRIAALEAVAAHHDAAQAARRNNPALSLETENFAGSAPFGGFDQAESTFGVSQTFRLGDKRRLEARAAEARAAIADSRRLVVLRTAELEAARRFYELAAATTTARFTEEVLDVSEAFEQAVARRAEPGNVLELPVVHGLYCYVPQGYVPQAE